MPYNWSHPDRKDAGNGVWDEDDRRVFMPKNHGWGCSVTSRRCCGA
jgi:hypothetical protein